MCQTSLQIKKKSYKRLKEMNTPIDWGIFYAYALEIVTFKDIHSSPKIFIAIPNFQQDISENRLANYKNFMEKHAARKAKIL